MGLSFLLLYFAILQLFTFRTISARRWNEWTPLPLCNETEEYDGTFMVVGPQSFQYGRPYVASIHLLKSFDGPLDLTVGIMNKSNKTVVESKKSIANPTKGTLEKIKLENIPGNLERNNQFGLFVVGTSKNGKEVFRQETGVYANLNPFTMFIQLDKSKYKPGALVRYRVLVVKPNGKPYHGAVNIKILDPERNVIIKADNRPLRIGVYSDRFQLSAEPPLGGWSIEVKVAGQNVSNRFAYSTRKRFRVEKYVLPKFDAQLKVDSPIKMGSDLVAELTAKYTYGKGLSGSAVIKAEQAYPEYIYDNNDFSKPPKVIKRDPIVKKVLLAKSGTTKATFTFSELKEAKLVNESRDYSSLRVRASVIEALTDIERDAGQRHVSFRTHMERINVELSDYTLIPGLKFFVKVEVTPVNVKIPLQPTASKQVFMNVTYDRYRYSDENGTFINYTVVPYEITLNDEFKGTLELVAPAKDYRTVNIEVGYGKKHSEVTSSTSGQFAESPSDTFIHLTQNDADKERESLDVGQTLGFTVETSKESGIDMVVAQVTSKSQVVWQQEVKLSAGQGQFSFEVTSEMAPRAQVLVYAIGPQNSEIIADGLGFGAGGMLKNKVEIKFNPNETEPYNSDGQKNEVELEVKADPKSYIGLLAVDKSVKLLGTGNDVTYNQVEGRLGWGFGRFLGRRWKRDVIYRRHGGSVASSIFSNANLVVLTDALLYRGCRDPGKH
jgi:CD109 antigen